MLLMLRLNLREVVFVSVSPCPNVGVKEQIGIMTQHSLDMCFGPNYSNLDKTNHGIVGPINLTKINQQNKIKVQLSLMKCIPQPRNLLLPKLALKFQIVTSNPLAYPLVSSFIEAEKKIMVQFA